MSVNQLLPNGNFVSVLLKFRLKKGIIEKFSYERRVYESEGNESLS